MTKRTISQIEAAIDVAHETMERIEAFMEELRVAAMGRKDFYVVGFEFGMFLAPKGRMLCGILTARKFASFIVARDNLVRNGKGEVARVMTWAEAIELSLRLQESALFDIRELFRGLCEELEEANRLDTASREQDQRDRDAEEAQWELAYNRALWEDSFRVEADAATASERKRKASAFIDAAHRESFLDDVEREGARPGRAALDRDAVDLEALFG